MHRAKHVSTVGGRRLRIEFEDGSEGVIDLNDRLFGPIFQPLQDPNLFARVTIDEFGVVCWPNGADLAPDALYESIVGKPTEQKLSLTER